MEELDLLLHFVDVDIVEFLKKKVSDKLVASPAVNILQKIILFYSQSVTTIPKVIIEKTPRNSRNNIIYRKKISIMLLFFNLIIFTYFD